MAENEDGQERTEAPSAKKLQDAKNKGQIPRSKELSTALVTLCGAAVLFVDGGNMGEALMALWRHALSPEFLLIDSIDELPSAFFSLLIEGLMVLLPLVAVVFVAAIVSPLALGGWVFKLTFKPEKLNPIKGVKQLFSVKSLMELLKSIAKVVLVGGLMVWLMIAVSEDIVQFSLIPDNEGVLSALWLLSAFFFLMCTPLLLIAAIDVPFQKFNFNKEMRMTKQEVRDEMKDTDGRPEIKAKIREAQQQLANARMMEEVPKADVVITNPTHFAVALKYDAAGGGAPVLLAKGADEMAARIREVAAEHDIPKVESPRLARAVYATTDLQQEIPSGLYLAVAQILAWVYQARQWEDLGGSLSGMECPPVPEPEVDDVYLRDLNPDDEEES